MGFDFGDLTRLGKKVFKAGAPLLGSALGGPAGGIVAELLGGSFGEDKDAPNFIGKLEAALLGDSAKVAEMKKWELDHEAKIKDLEFEAHKAVLADKASARAMHAENTKVTGKRDWNLYLLAWMTVLGFFGILIIIVYLAIQGISFAETVMVLLNVMLGCLLTNTNKVYDFFFGSSVGSKEKTNIIHLMGNGKSK